MSAPLPPAASSVPDSARLLDVLERYWGYAAFRPLQESAMHAILSGRDSVVVMPTGAGKSICFQAPALVADGVALVVSPLISLMKDQVDTLVGNGVAAACYNSALSSDRKAEVLADVFRRMEELLESYASGVEPASRAAPELRVVTK